MISIIIPTFNEENNIQHVINNICQSASSKDNYEIIVVDGGSSDNTINLAQRNNTKIVNSIKGRGNQLNNGARVAKGDILLFLHADTILPVKFDLIINKALTANKWGRFNITLSGSNILFRLIERMISLRSRITGIATGDQAIFVNTTLFNKISGFKNIPLMEDIELSKRLKKYSRPICLKYSVITSSRRWEENGIIRTVILMWLLRLLFFIGVDPRKLHNLYF